MSEHGLIKGEVPVSSNGATSDQGKGMITLSRNVQEPKHYMKMRRKKKKSIAQFIGWTAAEHHQWNWDSTTTIEKNGLCKNKKQIGNKMSKQKFVTCGVQQLLLCLECLGLCFHREKWSGLKSLEGRVHKRNEIKPAIRYLWGRTPVAPKRTNHHIE